MDKVMLLKYAALVIYIVFLIGLGVLVGLKGPYNCKRKACIRKANFMLSNMNTTLDPCQGFYRYACDNFKNIMTGMNGGEADVQSYIRDQIENTIDSFLTAPINVTDDRVLKIIKKMYQPCVEPNFFNRQKTKPLWDAIWTTGTFPVVDEDSWNEKEFSIGRQEEKSRRTGFGGGHIFDTYIAKDEKRPGRYIIHITPPKEHVNPGHEIVSEDYNKKLHDHYLSFIVRLIFHLMGNENYEADKELTNKYINQLNQTIPFKRALYEFYKDYKLKKEPIDLYNPMSIEELQGKFPILDWADFFKYMLPTSATPPKQVVIIGSSYFKDITLLILKSDKRMMANFLMLENVLESCLFMPREYFAIYNKFRLNMGWNNAQRPSFCEKVVKQKLKGAISSLLLEGYNTTFGSQAFLINVARKVKKDIKKSIRRKGSWMDAKTKENAIFKLKGLRLYLSLTDDQLVELTDYDARSKYYEDLCLGTRKTHVLPAYFCLNRFYSKKNWELLSRKPTVFDEDVDVITSGMKYVHNKNEIIIPYGVLKEPSYDGHWPPYINFGGVGSLVAQVIMAGLDIKGKDYDEFGFRNTWWTNESTASYKKRVECFGDKYTKYASRRLNMTVDGRTDGQMELLSTRISSVSGIRLAYQAYQEYLENRILEEQTMPGLENFTSTQLFFLSYANVRCGHYSNLKYRRMITRERVIPRGFLVFASLETMKEFSNAFNCSMNDTMVSKNECNMLF